MSEPGNSEPEMLETDTAEAEIRQGPSPVGDAWQQMVQAVLAIVLVASAVAMFHFYAPVAVQSAQPDDLHKQVQQLSQQVAQLEQQQAMPARLAKNHLRILQGLRDA